MAFFMSLADRRSPNRLVAIAISGQIIAYVLAIFVARRVTVAGFEAYVVASAIFILLATLAPLGSEKYTLRQFPALVAAGDWARAHGLLRFGVRRTLLTAGIAGAAVAGWALAGEAGETRAAIIIACLSLPGGALAHYALDLLTAAGRPFRALAVFRILVPGVALVLLLAASLAGVDLTGPMAVGSWGLAWLVALAVMVASLLPTLDKVRAATPVFELPVWRREAQPFFLYRIALALLSQAGVIALDLAGAPVGAYAAAMASVGMAAVLATATNRAYGRSLALLIDAGDGAGAARLKRARLVWLAPMMGVFLFVTLVFPGTVLGLFRPEFAAVGQTPLRLLALSTALTVSLSLSPTWLKFRGLHRKLYAATTAAAGAQLLLLAALVPPLGATGAALAHLGSMLLLYGSCAALAQRDMAVLNSI
jgi:O-antigen/teichoic acid export membrane protein